MRNDKDKIIFPVNPKKKSLIRKTRKRIAKTVAWNFVVEICRLVHRTGNLFWGDRDGVGMLTVQELRVLCCKYGLPVPGFEDAVAKEDGADEGRMVKRGEKYLFEDDLRMELADRLISDLLNEAFSKVDGTEYSIRVDNSIYGMARIPYGHSEKEGFTIYFYTVSLTATDTVLWKAGQ